MFLLNPCKQREKSLLSLESSRAKTSPLPQMRFSRAHCMHRTIIHHYNSEGSSSILTRCPFEGERFLKTLIGNSTGPTGDLPPLCILCIIWERTMPRALRWA